MTNVFDVARYILDKTGPLSSWKLQKLCYYSQAWSLAWTDKPLFQEDFEAWANGPVCPQLFAAHRGKFAVKPEMIPGKPDSLDEDERESIDVVIKDYGKLEPYELRELTHQEDPWKIARGDLPEDARCNAVITKDSMGEYYGAL